MNDNEIQNGQYIVQLTTPVTLVKDGVRKVLGKGDTFALVYVYDWRAKKTHKKRDLRNPLVILVPGFGLARVGKNHDVYVASDDPVLEGGLDTTEEVR